jgi:rhodanese-related sulfurtransferase
MNFGTISPRAVLDRAAAGHPSDLIDVRTPVEYRTLHADGAALVPLDRLDPRALLDARPADRRDYPVYLICKSGRRAAKAAQRFLDAGFANVLVVEGGTDAWIAAGCPVVRGKPAIALERQVRIAAGCLVLLGLTLAWTVSAYFLILTAFVGCGLVFAGVTDWCGMGLLLARAPWNRGNTGTRAACGATSASPQ